MRRASARIGRAAVRTVLIAIALPSWCPLGSRMPPRAPALSARRCADRAGALGERWASVLDLADHGTGGDGRADFRGQALDGA
ncbi:hypothetical protein GCM10010392_02630 [Streptomyces clavifer]|nr:hypothetical protein GCM10010392_02630 [Streptomyces clavifer]